MPFALPEYETASQHQAWLAIRALAIAGSALLQQVTFVTAEEIPTSVVSSSDGRTLEIPSALVGFGFSLDPSRLAAGELGDVLLELNTAAQVQANELERHMFQTLSSVSDFVGNVTDAGGKGLTLDVLTEAMATMDIAFDDDGKAVGLTLAVHPDQDLTGLHLATEEQWARHAAMLDRKRGEWEAKKRTRRLGLPSDNPDA